MSSIRYARVKSTINDENSDDNVNQLQTIDSGDDDEEDILPSVKIASVGNVEHGNQITHGAAARSTLMRTILWTGLLIVCYFILSIGLTFYQRWLLKVRVEKKVVIN
jgi:solute carrier family 35, member C2